MQSVLLVDDHDQARCRMRRLVEMVFDPSKIAEAATLAEGARQASCGSFDLVMLDLSLPDGDGESLIQPILEINSNSYIVISTVHDEGTRLIKALSLGAKGYLMKDQPEETLKQALEGVQTGIPPISASVTRRILEYLRGNSIEKSEPLPAGEIDQPVFARQSPNLDKLTPREEEVLKLLAQGLNRPDIAGMLNISKHTVATHVTNVYSKLKISNRSEAAMFARDLGLN